MSYPKLSLTGRTLKARSLVSFSEPPMIRRRLAAYLRLALLVALCCLAPVASARAQQVRFPETVVGGEVTVDQLLHHGADLERQRRWGEAVNYYEDAVRSNPTRGELRERLSLSRMRYDLARRYADSSFVDSLGRMPPREAFDLYAEVLLKIQSHYVVAPDWKQLVAHGTSQLESALTEPSFLQRNLNPVEPETIKTFETKLHAALDPLVINTRQQALEAVARAARLAEQELRLSQTAALFEYSCGALSSLDEYSSFLTAAQLDDVYSQIEGNFVGVGIEIKADNQALLLVNVIPGSPADHAGLKPGERIIEVDGHATKKFSTDAAADLLKGVQGSSVTVVVSDAAGAERRVAIRRDRVEVSSVEGARLIDAEAGVGYFKITSFQKTTSRDVDSALWQLHRNGMKSLVIDVRGNPGGLLTASVDVADKFLEAGNIVVTRGRSPSEDFDYKAHPVGTWQMPLVVLVDKDSASASEIFAGAIHDQRRGTIVGERSYGKGSVQGIFPLNIGGAGVRLTTAKFFSPSGRPISHNGVEPDVAVRRTAKPVLGSNTTEAALPVVTNAARSVEDQVMQTGLQLARQQLTQR